MIRIRPQEDRGTTRLDWLDSRHTFSFGDYRDPAHMGFRRLRVINDDVVQPGMGFGRHPHQDMEILTFMDRGALEHRDSLGNGSVIRREDVQRMSAGTGILHSEFNPSQDEEARLLQVWIEPEKPGVLPSWEQRSFPVDGPAARWQLVASRDGRDGSLHVNQDVAVHRGRLASGDEHVYEIASGRHVWLQVVSGELEVAGRKLATGDGLAASDEASLALRAIRPSDVLLFDLA
jgi:hypothetical protein